MCSVPCSFPVVIRLHRSTCFESPHLLVVIEYLISILKNGVNDSNLLPACIRDIWTSVRTHEGWPREWIDISQVGETFESRSLPETYGKIVGIHLINLGMLLYAIQMLLKKSDFYSVKVDQYKFSPMSTLLK